jgi:hypothetical protein
LAVPMRALSFEQILDNAFSLYGRNFAPLFGMTLVPQLPIALFWLLLPVLMPGTTVESMTMMSLLLAPYSLFAAVLTFNALTYAGAEAREGRRPAIGESLKAGLRRWLPAALAAVLSYGAILLGFVLLIVPGLILLAMFFAIFPAVVLEDRGAVAAMGRSRALSKGARLRILGVMLVAWLITFVPTVAMAALAGASAGMSVLTEPAAGGDVWVSAVMHAVSAIVSAVTWPFLMLVTLLQYFDRRARTEAPDLEAAAADLGNQPIV